MNPTRFFAASAGRLRVVLASALCVVCVGTPTWSHAASDAAHFWLSTTDSGSAGPEAPTITRSDETETTIYLWGRPTTGYQLRNVSLNIIASGTGLDLKDGTFLIKNTIGIGSERFQFVNDSSAFSSPTLISLETNAAVDSGATDALYGLGGFTLYPSSTWRGVGPVCTPGEVGCVLASDGEPAWVLAEFVIDTVDPGVVSLTLQVGDNGMNEALLAGGDFNFDGVVDILDLDILSSSFGSVGAALYEGDQNGDGKVDILDLDILSSSFGGSSTLIASSATGVRFGVDASAGDEPINNADTHRSSNPSGEDPDLTVTILSASAAVPEPSTLGGACWMALAWGATRRRRRS